MKLHCGVTDLSGNLVALQSLLGTLSKLTKHCTLRFEQNSLSFCQVENRAPAQRIFCAVKPSFYFSRYELRGYNEAEDNLICLDLNIEELYRVLKNATTASLVRLRLVVRGKTPFLNVEIRFTSLSASHKLLNHDIPARIIPQSQCRDETSPPDVPDFDVSVYLPNLHVLLKQTLSLRKLGNFATIGANNEGVLKISFEADFVKVISQFRNVELADWSTLDGAPFKARTAVVAPADTKKFAGVRVDLRVVNTFLNAHQHLENHRMILNVIRGRMLHFYYEENGNSFQYFIPCSAL